MNKFLCTEIKFIVKTVFCNKNLFKRVFSTPYIVTDWPRELQTENTLISEHIYHRNIFITQSNFYYLYLGVHIMQNTMVVGEWVVRWMDGRLGKNVKWRFRENNTREKEKNCIETVKKALKMHLFEI